MNVKEKIMPPLVLMIICIVISGLLVVAYNLTKVDNNGVLTEKMNNLCVNTFGNDTYKIIVKDDNGEKKPLTYDNVTNIITNESGDKVIFEVVVNGYAKDGIDLLVGINKNGKVTNVAIVGLKETPAQAQKVSNQDFLDKFKGADDVTNFKNIDGISGATYSSNGIKKAVQTALNTYSENKEAILNELS